MRKIKLNGEFLPYGYLKGWSISDKVNTISTLSCSINDLNGDLVLTEGMPIEFYNENEKLFGGIIRHPKKSETMPGFIVYNITALDNTAIANRRIIVGSHEDLTCGYIVTNFVMPILAQEGVTAEIVRAGATVSKANFNYISVAKCMQQLCDLSGFIWFIDKDKKLYFMSNDEMQAPFALTDSVQHRDFGHETSSIQYRNTQYIKAGKTETLLQVKELTTPQPNNVEKIFNVRFPLAKKPQIYKDSAEVSSTEIGINGLDKDKQFYYSYGSPTITTDEPVSAGDAPLEVTYVGLRNLLIRSEDLNEISKRAELEGSSGIYEAVDELQGVNTQLSATRYSTAQLKKYKQIEDKVTFNTEVHGLQAGQLLSVNKILYGINEKFLIDSISINPIDAESIEYSVSAIDGTSLGGWEDYFKRIINKTKGEISADDVIVEYKEINETEKQSGKYVITHNVDLVCGENTIISETTKIGEYTEVINLND